MFEIVYTRLRMMGRKSRKDVREYFKEIQVFSEVVCLGRFHGKVVDSV